MAAAMATEGSSASIFIVQVGKTPVARLRILAMVSSFLSGMRPSPGAWPWAVSFVITCRMALGSFVCHHLPHGLGRFRLSSPAAWSWAVSFVITCRMALDSFVCRYLPHGFGNSACHAYRMASDSSFHSSISSALRRILVTSSWPSGEVTLNSKMVPSWTPRLTIAFKKSGNLGWLAAKRDHAFFIFINLIGLIIGSLFLIIYIA